MVLGHLSSWLASLLARSEFCDEVDRYIFHGIDDTPVILLGTRNVVGTRGPAGSLDNAI